MDWLNPVFLFCSRYFFNECVHFKISNPHSLLPSPCPPLPLVINMLLSVSIKFFFFLFPSLFSPSIIYNHPDMEAAQVSISRWVDKKSCGTFTQWNTKYTQPHKKGEQLPFGTARMDLESTMLSEISQSETDKYHMMSLTCGIYWIEWTNKQNLCMSCVSFGFVVTMRFMYSILKSVAVYLKLTDI